MEIKDSIIKAVRDVPDFPVKGVIFKDITPILSDIDLYNKIVETIVDKYKDKNITKIAALESRGFIFGISIAQKLNVPFIPIRKKGKFQGNIPATTQIGFLFRIIVSFGRSEGITSPSIWRAKVAIYSK